MPNARDFGKQGHIWMSESSDQTDSTDYNSLESVSERYMIEFNIPRKHGKKHYRSELGRQGFFQRRHFPIQSVYFFKLKNHPTIFAN